MRTSSIKSTVSTLMIVVLLTLAAPIAEARANRTSSRGRGETFFSAFVSLIKRIGRVTVTGAPPVPGGEPQQQEGNCTTPEPEPAQPEDN